MYISKMNNMKKINQRAIFLLFVSLVIFAGLPLSCDDKDSSNTKEVELLSFGPCPIPRGGELRIIGKNLDQVGSVILPGCDAISDFKMKTASEIQLIVPKNAEYGKIILKAGGQEITSISNLSIDGSIELTSFSPITAKAGATIKLEGKDFDFVQEVIFTSDIHILEADFISHTKEVIEVKLPIEAQTGNIALSGQTQGNQVTVYFENELNVILPTITALSHKTIKAGNVLTITGMDFDLVESISFGGLKVAESFAVNDAKTSITVKVPVDAQDGAVVFTAFSGVKVSSAEDLVMLMPTITSITPNPVKVREEITVIGTDLDLIVGVAFGDGKQAGTIPPGGTATEMKIPVPATAKDGTIVFTTRANKTVASEVITILQEGGSKQLLWEGSVGPCDWSGTHYIPIDVSQLAPGQTLGFDIECFTGTNYWQLQVYGGSWWETLPGFITFNNGNNGVKSFASDDTNFEFVIDQADIDCITKQGTALLCCGNGVIIKSVYIKVPQTLLWEGRVGPCDWSGSHYVGPLDLSQLSPGKILGFNIECDSGTNYWQLQVYGGSWWETLPGFIIFNNGNNGVKSFAKDDTNFEFVIEQADIDCIRKQGTSLLCCGNGVIITKLYLK